jgi:hypothetical protein
MRDGYPLFVVYGYSLFIVLVRGVFIVLVAFRVVRDFYVWVWNLPLSLARPMSSLRRRRSLASLNDMT